MHHQAPLAGYKLNRRLARYLETHPDYLNRQVRVPSLYPSQGARRLIKDRLTEVSIARLIAEFKSGIPKRNLAKRYGIGVTSIKLLLRERGVKRRSKYDRLT